MKRAMAGEVEIGIRELVVDMRASRLHVRFPIRQLLVLVLLDCPGCCLSLEVTPKL